MISDSTQPRVAEKDLLDILWNELSSVRMAIWLLSISAVAILVGTLVEQNQPFPKYVATYGPTLSHIMQTIGVFDLYHTWWFELLMAFISINLILSNFNRAEKILKKYYDVPVRIDPGYFESAVGRMEAKVPGTLEEAALKLENAFLRLSYRIRLASDGLFRYYYVDKGRVAIWGSFIAHIGLLLLFVGVIYGHFPGQSFERSVALLEGGSYYIPESHFSFRLRQFDAEWDANRRPLLYRSTLAVLDDNGKEFTQPIEVNHPLVHRGVKIYQATYGPGRILGHYVDGAGKSHPFSVEYSEDRMMFFPIKLGGGKQWVGVLRHFVPDFAVAPNGEVGSLSKEPVNPACYLMAVTRIDKMPPDPKSIKPVGWLTKSHPGALNDVKFYLDRVSLFSGFQLRRDPGVPIIYLSFIIILIGVGMTFYIHHKVIRALVRETPEGVQLSLVGVRRDKEQEYEKDFSFIKDRVS